MTNLVPPILSVGWLLLGGGLAASAPDWLALFPHPTPS